MRPHLLSIHHHENANGPAAEKFWYGSCSNMNCSSTVSHRPSVIAKCLRIWRLSGLLIGYSESGFLQLILATHLEAYGGGFGFSLEAIVPCRGSGFFCHHPQLIEFSASSFQVMFTADRDVMFVSLCTDAKGLVAGKRHASNHVSDEEHWGFLILGSHRIHSTHERGPSSVSD